MKIKRFIYFIPLLLIGCKEAPKDYYSVGEVEVVNLCSDTIWTDTIWTDNNDTTIVTTKDVRATQLRHILNPEETAPHTVKIRVIK